MINYLRNLICSPFFNCDYFFIYRVFLICQRVKEIYGDVCNLHTILRIFLTILDFARTYSRHLKVKAKHIKMQNTNTKIQSY